MDEETRKEIDELKKRMSALENKGVIKQKSKTKKEFSGVLGGIQFLIEQGFFNTPKSVKQIFAKLEAEGYYKDKKTMDRALRRDFTKNKKVLDRVKKDGVWHYVIKK